MCNLLGHHVVVPTASYQTGLVGAPAAARVATDVEAGHGLSYDMPAAVVVAVQVPVNSILCRAFDT